MKLPSRLVALWFVVAAPLVPAPAGNFQEAVKARIEKNYAVVLYANGTKTMVPLASLTPADRQRLQTLATESPLARGKSEVVIAREPAKQTILSTKTEAGTETVQLCPPRLPRDQLGGTCMLYSTVHFLDIAGFYVDNAAIYRVSNGVDPENPWKDLRYHQGIAGLFENQTPRPMVHNLPSDELDPFEWARRELRKGRPILAAFPREIWQALPPGFIAAHPWGGGSVGHQVVVNGFTWNKLTGQGSFHIVNSWDELPEFDLKTESAKGGAMVIMQSLSPKGEPAPQVAKEIVKKVTLIRAVGKTNLYEVETNLGTKRIAAVDEEAARAVVEDAR